MDKFWLQKSIFVKKIIDRHVSREKFYMTLRIFAFYLQLFFICFAFFLKSK